ncbi:MAG: MurR/RpiR family transcriptional regulator [Clostridiales bacterium]|jgi:DNA-binding MurR/RpiR family transcriptional regulator|nr:MurR/RpiR family transcriptional regulator [Clostridiales bacterium]
MEEIDLLNTIQQKVPELSKGQKRIAKFLIEDYDKAIYLTASKLGEVTGVSESTVVRFAIELGFDGYPKLQRALVDLVKTKLTASQRIQVSSDRMERSDKSILKAILESDSERIHRTLNEIDENVFKKCVNEIISAKKVYVFGGRSSFSLASFLHFYLNLMLNDVILINSYASTEIFEQIYKMDNDDLFIGISFPRYSQRTIRAMEYAGKRGASTIAITDSKVSPLIKYSDLSLTARSDMVSFVDSLVAPMSVINALLVGISVSKKDDLIKNLDNLERIWNEYQVYTSNST